MVAVGDKLGGRYFVTKVTDKPAAGSFFEVRDAQGGVFHAQLLLATPLSQPELNLLAREVAAVPQCPALVLPEEITQAQSGEPFAVYKQAPHPSLTAELPVWTSGGNAARRLVAQRALFRGFAALAEEYGKAVGARSAHGAISVDTLGVAERGDEPRFTLSGFGLEPATRLASKKERPAPRVDAATLLLTLHDALTRAQALPEGSAQAKWSIAQSCARAGEHPALQNCVALAKFLRDVLFEIEQSARAAASRSADPSPERPTEASSSASKGSKPVSSASARAWFESNRRVVVLGGVGLVAAAVASVALSDDGPSSSSSPGVLRAAPPPTSASPALAAACGEEPVASPSTAELAGAAWSALGVCEPDGAALHIVASTGDVLAGAHRPSRRGGAFAGAPTTWTDHMAEPGTAFTSSAGAWFAWRPTGGAAFAVTRVASSPTELRARSEAWPGGPFRGAFLLEASDTGAWIASTLESAEGPSVVAVRLSWNPGPDAPMIVYRLSAGSVEAVIPSNPPQLLVRVTRERQHTFTSVSASVSVIPVIAQAPTGHADGGGASAVVREVPEVSLQRTGSFVVEADSVAAAPYGVAPANAPRYFVITAGQGADAGRCVGARCLRDGVVSLVGFSPSGDASQVVLTEHGRGLDVALNGNGHPVALACEAASCSLYTRESAEQPARERLAVRGMSLAQITRCGAEPWLVFATDANPAHVGALPLACVSARSASR